jgi:hypothetical protein
MVREASVTARRERGRREELTEKPHREKEEARGGVGLPKEML